MTGPFRCSAGQGDLTLSAEAVYRDSVGGTDAQQRIQPAEPGGPLPVARARRRLTPDERRQALIDAALNLFNTRPYDDVLGR